MSPEETEKVIENQLRKLPDDIRNVVLNTPLSENLISIGKRNGLHVDLLGELETEATLVLIGLQDPNNFVSDLMDGLKIPHDKAVAIARDVDKTIFSPIRTSLQKMHEPNDNKAVSEEAPHNLPVQIKEPALNILQNKLEEDVVVEEKKNESKPPSLDPYKESVE